MRQRLALVVLVPTLAFGVFGGVEAWARSVDNRHASEVEARVERAGVLLRVKLLLTSEIFSTGGAAMAAEFGVQPELLVGILGYDPARRAADDRRKVDVAATTTDLPEVAAPYRRLQAARAAHDAGSIELPELIARYSVIQGELTELATEGLDRAEDGAGDVRSNDLRRATSTLRSSVDAATAVGVQLDGLAKLLTAAAPSRPQEALEEVRLGWALEQVSGMELGRLTRGPLRRQWIAVRDSPVARTLRATSQRFSAMAPSEVPSLALDELIGLFAGGLESLDGYDDLTAAAAASTMAAAADVHERSTRDLQLAMALVVAVALAALAVAGFISRSIALPLQALARRAGRVTGGHLDDHGGPGGGPQELVEVSTTIEELVDNLRVVESQVGALAAGALSDPVLEVPVPGRLGTLLHDSVLRLSRSMAEREVLSNRLEHDATHDPLTGLANRASFIDALRLALIEPEGEVAVLKVDLDGFKPVNETHGHDTGDRLLRVTADRLQADVGPGGLVARIGGDEFGVVVTGRCAGEVDALARRLIEHVAAPVRVGAVVTQVRASAGVAVSDEAADGDTLLRRAGLAATAAKACGGGIVRFDAAMLGEVERRADIEHRLQRALVDGGLFLDVQPIVDTDLTVLGGEALLRWRSDDGTVVMPGEFIPVAEASDLIVDVGRWVLREACALLAGWRDDPVLRDLRLSVNLSGRHVLSMTVVDDVRSALDCADVDPSRLAIEVTETVLLSDLSVATDHLGRLRALGVLIAVDDFGTGYTSLAHLRQLPVDLIKVDRSLVVAAADRAADARVLELVVGAAHAMGMEVVAEGVETRDQLAVIQTSGCDHVQGYLIARPGPVSDLRSLAAATSPGARRTA